MVCTFEYPKRWCQMSPPPAVAKAFADIAGVAVAVAVTRHGVVVGAAKAVVTVEVEAAPVVPLLIRQAPRAEAALLIARRPGIVDERPCCFC